MGKIRIWSLKKIIYTIVETLLNNFDCFIIIEGNRGLGKSTFAYKISRGVSKEMKRRGNPNYRFNPKKCLLYTKTEVIRFFHKWQRTGIGDEMINVSFNRDFYDEDQKNLIKMINMNRDHENLFIGCVPQFQTLDNQIKNLCKIRFTVVRRGLAVIQTPNRTIYGKDKWDQATNEKIERAWLKKGIQNPQYSRLTTFRGIIKFPKLTEKQEEEYMRIKTEKRNIVAKEQMGINLEDVDVDIVDTAIKMLEQGRIRNGLILDGMAYANNLKPDTFKRKLRDILKAEGKPHQLSSYFWDTKKDKGGAVGSGKGKVQELINSIEDK